MKENFKSGFVTLIGRPNVGKSTLMNHLIGQKIAITSNKPQTTRNRIQTVLTTEEGQIVFVDTPGIHKAKNKLGEYMVNIAERSLNEVDVVLWLVEPSNFIGAGEKHIIEQLKKVKTPVILVINKIDMVKRALDQMRKNFPYNDGDQPMYFIHAIRVLCTCTKDRSSDYLKNIIIKESAMGKVVEVPDIALDKHTKRGQEMGRGSKHFFEEATKVIPQLEIDNDYRERYGKILETYDPDHVVENAFKYSSEQY